MSDPENTEAAPSEVQGEAKPRPRGGRRRGGRGRSRKKVTPDLEAAPIDSPPSASEAPLPNVIEAASVENDSEASPTSTPGAPAQPTPSDKPRSAPPRPPQRREPQRPANRRAIQDAQRQVQQIIESLQQTLEEMEAVQRLLDQVNLERTEDQRDLVSLRRSLNQLQSQRSDFRPRGGRS